MLLTSIIVILSIINVLSCVLMILVVLMQRSKSDGIGASFGGGITDSMFGAQTSNVLVKTTTVLAIAFLSSATLLASSLAFKNKKQSAIQEQLQTSEAAPATPPSNTPPELPAQSSPNVPATTGPVTAPAPISNPIQNSGSTPTPQSPTHSSKK